MCLLLVVEFDHNHRIEEHLGFFRFAWNCERERETHRHCDTAKIVNEKIERRYLVEIVNVTAVSAHET